MKKRTIILLSVMLFSCMLCVACGDKEDKTKEDNVTNSQQEKINLTKQINKLCLYMNDKVYETKDSDKINIMSKVLKDVSKIDGYQPELEGYYDVKLYNNEELVYDIAVYEQEVIIIENGTYKKDITSDLYNEIKSMLVGLAEK